MSREKRLNQEMLVANIQRICTGIYNEVHVSELMHKGGQRHRVEIQADGLEFYVDFHFKANGSTSIDVSSGQHLDYKKKIMAAILADATCLLADGGQV